MTYREAEEACSSRSARLAVIKNVAELELVKRTRYSHRYAFWVGMTDIKKEGEWVWSDGTNVNLKW